MYLAFNRAVKLEAERKFAEKGASNVRVETAHSLAFPAAKQFAINFKDEILYQTRVFLDKMNKGEVPVLHDFYLKKYQLSKPALYYDTILFDEGQDASESMLDIFLSQKATKVIVFDQEIADRAVKVRQSMTF